MRRMQARSLFTQRCVGQVRNGIRDSTKNVVGIPPRPAEGLGGTRPKFFRQDPGGDIPLEKVRLLGPDPHDKIIRYTHLHHVDGPMTGVRIVHTLQDSLQGMAKLH